VIGIFNRAKVAPGMFGGVLMLVCSFVLMWAGVASDVATDKKLQQVVQDSIDIDANTPDPSNNGKLVIAGGEFRTSDFFEDEYLKANGSLIVQRRVEMMQWVEVQGRDGAGPEYTLQWVEGQVDFFQFKTPQGHENPLVQVTPIRYLAQQSRFGGFDGSRLLPLIGKLDRLQLTPDMLKDASQEVSQDKIVLRRNSGSDLAGLGDTRVWYEVLPQGDYTVLTVQEDERNLVGASPSATLFIRKGLLSSEDFQRDLEGEANQSFLGMFYLGGGLLFFALISILMPKKHGVDLRPHINAQGAVAVLIVSAAGSFVAMSLFFLLSLTR
jgi:hypothetical protein